MATSPARLLAWANGCDDEELAECVLGLIPGMKTMDTRPFAESPTVPGILYLLEQKRKSLLQKLGSMRRGKSRDTIAELSKTNKALEKVRAVVECFEGPRDYDSDDSESTCES